MKLKPFLYGFITGGLTAGIGILLTAPNSGKVTKVRIKENKQFMLNQLEELKTNLLQLKDSVAQATIEGRTQMTEFLAEVKTALAHWEEDIQPQQQMIQKELVEMKETVQEFEEKISEYSK